jgi:hypothetical protein
MKHLQIAAASLALAASACAQAAPIVVGSLSREPAEQVIHDSLNNREWLGWDVTRGLNYAQTVAAIQPGGRSRDSRLPESRTLTGSSTRW